MKYLNIHLELYVCFTKVVLEQKHFSLRKQNNKNRHKAKQKSLT